MTKTRVQLVVLVGLALAVGFLVGTWRAGPTMEFGRAQSTGNGGGSIMTDGWTYGFPADVAWTDTTNRFHPDGLPDCLPPLSSVEGLRFAWVGVSVEGWGWRQVVWVDCRGIPQPSAAPASQPAADPTGSPIPGPPAATLIFRTAKPPSGPTPPPSMNIGCAGGALGPFILHGSTSGTEVLVWLEQDDHRQIAAIWPAGFTAQFNPELELHDPEAGLVAREGDTIEGGGGQDEQYSNLLYIWSFNGMSYPCQLNGWVEP